MGLPLSYDLFNPNLAGGSMTQDSDGYAVISKRRANTDLNGTGKYRKLDSDSAGIAMHDILNGLKTKAKDLSKHIDQVRTEAENMLGRLSTVEILGAGDRTMAEQKKIQAIAFCVRKALIDNKSKEAAKVLELDSSLVDKCAELKALQGDVFVKSDEPVKALACYDNALKLDPNNPSAQFGKYQIQIADRETTAANKTLRHLRVSLDNALEVDDVSLTLMESLFADEQALVSNKNEK